MAKELVVYFSVYGTAKIVAEEIAKQAGADLAKIEPVIPYDSNRDHYNALAGLAKKEHDEDQRPAIKNEIDIDSYDRIYIGYPMWWYTFPMIIYTFFFRKSCQYVVVIPVAVIGDNRLDLSDIRAGLLRDLLCYELCRAVDAEIDYQLFCHFIFSNFSYRSGCSSIFAY